MSPEDIQRMSFKLGYDVASLEGVRRLMAEVEKKTGVRIGRNTLRRLFGLDQTEVKTRKSTLNVIAVALGYLDWDKFLQEKPSIEEGLYPGVVLSHDMTVIDKGVLAEISWTPDRGLTLEHLGEGQYVVLASEKGKLRKDDILSLGILTVGLPFSAFRVLRNHKDIGPYNAAAWSAIEEILFFPKEGRSSSPLEF